MQYFSRQQLENLAFKSHKSLPYLLFIDDFGLYRNMYRAFKAFYLDSSLSWITANEESSCDPKGVHLLEYDSHQLDRLYPCRDRLPFVSRAFCTRLSANVFTLTSEPHGAQMDDVVEVLIKLFHLHQALSPSPSHVGTWIRVSIYLEVNSNVEQRTVFAEFKSGLSQETSKLFPTRTRSSRKSREQ